MASALYEALPKDHVRFVRLLPGDDIVAKVETWPLEQAPTYTALSYMWGPAIYRDGRSPDAVYTITLNDRTFQVQENLHDALSCLVPQIRDSNMLLWVDAICINQDDVKERSVQILHMRYLYSHATQVYGWLGFPRDEMQATLAVDLMSDLLAALMERVAAVMSLEAAGSEHALDGTKMSTLIKDINVSFLEREDCEGWAGIHDLLSRPYWRRTWIYQEVTGPAPTSIWCGSHKFDLDMVYATCCLGQHFPSLGKSSYPLDFIVESQALAMCLFRDPEAFGSSKRLVDLIELTRRTECSDPRDKVYAFLGLAIDFDASAIVSDYSKTVGDVYKDVVRFTLLQPQYGLSILNFVKHYVIADDNDVHCARPKIELPSWVPDFSRDIGRGTEPFDHLFADGSWAYKACGPYHEQNAEIDGIRLRINGVKIDEIAQISVPLKSLFWEGSPVNPNHENLEVFRSWAVHQSDSSYIGQTVDEVVRTTIVADVTVYPRRRGYAANWDLLETSNSSLTDQQLEYKDNMGRAISMVAPTRRLCTTATGRIGLVPPTAQVGDLLYVFLGGPMVYVLRPKRTGVFEFIGSSYIHGIMDGEIFEDHGINIMKKEAVVLE
ncbi:MAG: hypothetical protein L6R42_004510 [Xanthoria sp. 1 TBL-2021]|nr:MAG: hypothetical protein L6R42_004510 [Xanthoria sp. 1 TBL-2021]